MRQWIDIITESLEESFGNTIDWNPRAANPNLQLFNLDIAASRGQLTKEDRRDFAAFLRDHKNDFVRMYHGTAVTHDVMGQGLLPTSPTRAKSLQSASGYVYLTYDPASALEFARMAYSGQYKDLVVYGVEVTIGRLLADADQLRNKRYWGGDASIGNTLADSLIYGRGARVKGKIEPMQVFIFGRYDHNGNPLSED